MTAAMKKTASKPGKSAAKKMVAPGPASWNGRQAARSGALKRRRVPRWSVYILRTRDGALYTGIALDVRRRLEQHIGAARGGAKALRGRGPLRLELSRAVGSRALAQAVEWRIKRLPRTRKLDLIAVRAKLDGLVVSVRRRQGAPRRSPGRFGPASGGPHDVGAGGRPL
jgi:putative endonuclease